MLGQLEKTTGYMSCGTDGDFRWKGIGISTILKTIYASTREVKLLDNLASGVWASSIPKTSLLLWRVRKKRLPTMERLQQRGADVETSCKLCEGGDGAINHIYNLHLLIFYMVTCKLHEGNKRYRDRGLILLD